ncbi:MULTISPECIES: NUDIX hydrolase [unclassified Virgibacillus]|uniref:NUDIX hydrolase n=1 Tax=unclassified Virgibacillus TaxID=2620237 RepID=UPI0024DE15B3|nr:NUDIX hydrolase [Virgibacillus sp. LDC-1]
MKNFEEKTINSKAIFKGNVVELQVDEVLLPNGKTASRELIKHPGAVGVIAITRDKKIVFVKQYRKALEKTLIEIPAGKLEKGEKPERTAIRELEEETGYTTNELRFVDSFYTSPGFADEHMYIYLTDQLSKLETPPAGDDDEFVELLELTLDEAKQLVYNQEIQDAKTNYSILYLDSLGL